MSAQRIDLRPPDERAGTSGARVFIHRACEPGTARHEALQAALVADGFDAERYAIVDRGLGLKHELVRVIERSPTRVLLERFDGSRYSKELLA